ncbi:MAG: hypothetical protein QM783_01405 [Phycisphaerales bacterium]
MTPPTLQALFAAKAAGYTVDDKVISDALDAMENARNSVTKEMVYAGAGGKNPKDNTGGAGGRMSAAETVLVLGGRGSIDNVRNAVNTFITHWEELDKRRQMSGTHLPPYMVAPYYFYYAHYYAAQAIEQLPEAERPALREKCNKLLFSCARKTARGTTASSSARRTSARPSPAWRSCSRRRPSPQPTRRPPRPSPTPRSTPKPHRRSITTPRPPLPAPPPSKPTPHGPEGDHATLPPNRARQGAGRRTHRTTTNS